MTSTRPKARLEGWLYDALRAGYRDGRLPLRAATDRELQDYKETLFGKDDIVFDVEGMRQKVHTQGIEDTNKRLHPWTMDVEMVPVSHCPVCDAAPRSGQKELGFCGLRYVPESKTTAVVDDLIVDRSKQGIVPVFPHEYAFPPASHLQHMCAACLKRAQQWLDTFDFAGTVERKWRPEWDAEVHKTLHSIAHAVTVLS